MDWLPDKKYYEYAYHKFFNPEVEYANWEPWDEWDYPERDVLRFGQIIKNSIFNIWIPYPIYGFNWRFSSVNKKSAWEARALRISASSKEARLLPRIIKAP